MFRDGKLSADIAMQLLAGTTHGSPTSGDIEDISDAKRKHSSPTKDAELASPPPKDPKNDGAVKNLDARITCEALYTNDLMKSLGNILYHLVISLYQNSYGTRFLNMNDLDNFKKKLELLILI